MNFSEFIRSEWGNLFYTDFAFLDAFPSSEVKPIVVVLKANKAEFDPSFCTNWSMAKCNLQDEAGVRISELIYEEVERSRLSYLPIKDLKTIINNLIKKEDPGSYRDELIQAQQLWEGIATPNAKETRKVFFPKLESVLGSKPSNVGGGCWNFPVVVNGQKMLLVMDFGGMFTGFTYWVDVYPNEKPRRLEHWAYEDILGFGYQAQWNLMRSDQLAVHAEVFVLAVQKTLKAVEQAVKC